MSQTTETEPRPEAAVRPGAEPGQGAGAGVPGAPAVHPVVGFARSLEAALGRVAVSDPVFMTEPEKEEALALLYVEEQRLAAVRMRIMAAGQDVADEHAARDVAAWLAHQTQADSGAVHRDLRLAQSLERRWSRVGQALGAGQVNLGQAHAIADALEQLPAELDAETLVRAEEHLVSVAPDHSPHQLRVLGRRILEVVAPEIADAEEGRKLEAEERRARERASLRFRPLGTGATRISLQVPDAVAERLRTYLDAFTSPRRSRGGAGGPGERDSQVRTSTSDPSAGSGTAGSGTAGSGTAGSGTDASGTAVPSGFSDLDRIPAHRVQAQAFCALLEHLNPAALPDHGGDATHMMVTIGLDQLREQLAAAGLVGSTGAAGSGADRVSATEARRLACTAKIFPAVLGGNGEILDLGRSQRLFSPAQRRAMALRDRRCRAEGCDIPAAWCEAHHLQPWSHGGRTDLDDGVLLCSWHHHRIHDQRYRYERRPDGDYRFTRRT